MEIILPAVSASCKGTAAVAQATEEDGGVFAAILGEEAAVRLTLLPQEEKVLPKMGEPPKQEDENDVVSVPYLFVAECYLNCEASAEATPVSLPPPDPVPEIVPADFAVEILPNQPTETAAPPPAAPVAALPETEEPSAPEGVLKATDRQRDAADIKPAQRESDRAVQPVEVKKPQAAELPAAEQKEPEKFVIVPDRKVIVPAKESSPPPQRVQGTATGFSVPPGTAAAAAAGKEMPGTTQLAARVVEQIFAEVELQRTGKNGVEEIRVRLVPESLGEVVLNISRDEGKIRGRITVENAFVRELLETRLFLVRERLQGMGIEWSEVEVAVGGSPQRENQAGLPGRKSWAKSAARAKLPVTAVEVRTDMHAGGLDIRV